MSPAPDEDLYAAEKRVLAAVEPLISETWRFFVRSSVHGGEYYVALDDAMQGLAEAGRTIPEQVRGDMDAILAELRPSDIDHQRITHWISKQPATPPEGASSTPG